MNKLKLIDMLKSEHKLTKKDAAAVVELFFESMSEAIAKGDRVEIRGLCSFYVKEYKPYQGRNRINIPLDFIIGDFDRFKHLLDNTHKFFTNAL